MLLLKKPGSLSHVAPRILPKQGPDLISRMATPLWSDGIGMFANLMKAVNSWSCLVSFSVGADIFAASYCGSENPITDA